MASVVQPGAGLSERKAKSEEKRMCHKEKQHKKKKGHSRLLESIMPPAGQWTAVD